VKAAGGGAGADAAGGGGGGGAGGAAGGGAAGLSSKDLEEAEKKALRRATNFVKIDVAHLFSKTPDYDDLVKKAKDWDEKIVNMEALYKNKDDNKEVALGALTPLSPPPKPL
jgi:hypothetical protein